MRGREKSVIDVGALLEKIEAAAPIDAVEVVAEELGARRRPEGRRHDGLPGLVRGSAPRPRHHPGCRPRPRLAAGYGRGSGLTRKAAGNVWPPCASTGPGGLSSPDPCSRRASPPPPAGGGWPGRSWGSRPTWRCSSATPTAPVTPRRHRRTRSSPPPTAW